MSSKNTFRLVIASVGDTKFDGDVTSLTVPGEAGVMTLLPHHEAIVSTLKDGAISVKTSEGLEKKWQIENGVLECSGGKAVILL